MTGNGGWTDLFDGETLSGWGVTGNEEGWIVERGMIKCLAQNGGYLYTRGQFEDFVLSVDFRMEERTNSGIFIRWSDLEDPVHSGIEVQILDRGGEEETDTHSCGALYDMVAPSHLACNPPGEWNNFTIKASGPFISVEHNGDLVSCMDVTLWTEAERNPDGTPNKFRHAWKNMPRRGHIGLQDHNGVIWFKGIRIREL